MTTEPPEPHIWDSGEQWNVEHFCNWCKTTRTFWNPNVLNPNTGKKLALEEPYFPNSGTQPKVHWGCMKKGEGNHQYYSGGKVDEAKTRYIGIGVLFDKSVFLFSDNSQVRKEKVKIQRKLQNIDDTGLNYAQRVIRDTPIELRLKYTQQYANEWKAQSFNSK